MESEFVVGLVGLAVSLLLHSQSISIPPTRLTPEGEVTVLTLHYPLPRRWQNWQERPFVRVCGGSRREKAQKMVTATCVAGSAIFPDGTDRDL